MLKTTICLASSSELKAERATFELAVNRRNKLWHDDGIFLHLEIWEDFIDAMSRTRLQDEYNAAIERSDIFVLLVHTRLGLYSAEEFEIAHKRFKERGGRPLIYTYIKNPPEPGDPDPGPDYGSVRGFRARLAALGHFDTPYANVEGLIDHFMRQLDKLRARGFIEAAGGAASFISAFRAAQNGNSVIDRSPQARAVAARGALVEGDNRGTVHTGDIHVHLDAASSGATLSPAALRRAYLHRIWKQTDTLALMAGGDTQKPVRLQAVYTALMTELRDARADDSNAESAEYGHRAAAGDDRTLSAVDALDRAPRLVLLGGPGSGKSTFVQHVAQCMAGELLAGDAEKPEPRLASLTEPSPSGGAGSDAPAAPVWRHGALMPVLVVLRDLAAQLPPAGSTATADDVWRYVCRGLDTASLGEYAPELKAELHRGCLVMFDGLDEVPDAEQRRKQIQQAVHDFAASFARCRILVTSRTYAYQQQDWKLPGFTEAPLRPFDGPLIHAFVDAWYRHMAELLRLTPDDAAARAALLRRQIDARPRVAELAARPLLLTLFARLQTERGSKLPEQPAELYHAAVEMLLNDWESAKPRRGPDGSMLLEPSLSEWLKASRDDVRRELDRLAFEAHRDQQELQGTADIRQARLIEALLRASGQRSDVQPLRLQEYLRDRAGILVEHGVGMLQFPHRSFQEYLAACHLANDDFPEQIAHLARRDPVRWREAALLAGAHAARGNKGLPTWALVEALCPADLSPHAEAPDAWGALLAGQVLAASGEHANPVPRNRAKLERVCGAQLALLQGTALPAVERALAGRLLARLGDPRPEVRTIIGMQFCWVPAGRFEMGEADDDLAPLHTVDLPYGYFIARYPVSVSQWKEFVRKSGSRPDNRRSLAGYDNQPATSVTWHDALRFSNYLTAQSRYLLPRYWIVTLPSEAEWEKAARGGHQIPALATPSGWLQLRSGPEAELARNPLPRRGWPWGDSVEFDRANAVESLIGTTSTLGMFPLGRSPYGCEDMAGNVLEWTRSLWSTKLRYPHQPLDNDRGSLNAGDQVHRLVRGGAWYTDAPFARCAFRDWAAPNSNDGHFGFRVVVRPALD